MTKTYNLTSTDGLNSLLPVYFFTQFDYDDANQFVKCLTAKNSITCYSIINKLCLRDFSGPDGLITDNQQYADCLIDNFKKYGLDSREICDQTYQNNFHEFFDTTYGVDTNNIVPHFKKYYH